MTTQDPTTSQPEILHPKRPHDGLSFEAFERTYSFDEVSDRRRVLGHLIWEEILRRSDGAMVLDIGCGSGMGDGDDRYEYVRAIGATAERLIGLEPDTSVNPPDGIFETVERCLFEDTKLPDASVDIAYSHFVMEHVEHPDQFLATLHRILKPGGVYFFITPNGQHYFVKTAAFLNKIGLDERLLPLLRGAETVEGYHYPVVYAFNRPSQIGPLSVEAGFMTPRYVRFEQRAGHSYFPGPLRPVWWGLMLKRRLLKNQRCLGNLIGRIEKPSAD